MKYQRLAVISIFAIAPIGFFVAGCQSSHTSSSSSSSQTGHLSDTTPTTAAPLRSSKSENVFTDPAAREAAQGPLSLEDSQRLLSGASSPSGSNYNVSSMNSSTGNTTSVTGLAANSWVLVKLGDTDVSMPTANAPTLVFDSGKSMVTGFAGVNRFTGVYTADGSTLRMGPLASTKMAGTASEASALENQYIQALGGVTNWRISAGKLELTDGQKTLATFAPASP